MEKRQILLFKTFTYTKDLGFNFVLDDFKNQGKEDHYFGSLFRATFI